MKPSELRDRQWIKLQVKEMWRQSGAIGFHNHKGDILMIALDRADPVTDLKCGIEILGPDIYTPGATARNLEIMDEIYDRWKDEEAIEVLTSED